MGVVQDKSAQLKDNEAKVAAIQLKIVDMELAGQVR